MIAIFHHILAINEWEKITNKQLELIKRIEAHEQSNLHYEVTKLALNQMKEYETPTLTKLWDYARQNPGAYICYIHTKGITKPNRPDAATWRQTLNYWVLYKYKLCLEQLEQGADTTGCRFWEFVLRGKKFPHYSGNFWWAKANYIASLQAPIHYVKTYYPKFNPDQSDPQRFGCEFWIGSGNGKHSNVHDDFRISSENPESGGKTLSFQELQKKYG